MAKAKTPQLRFDTNSSNWIYGVYREARRIAGTISHDDDIADDLTQNLIVELLNADTTVPFITTWWLIARLKARLINYRLAERRRMLTFLREPEDGIESIENPELNDNEAPSAEQIVWLRQLERAFRQAIAALPTDEMKKIILLKLDDATDPEIAATLGLSANVALVRRFEAQQILQVHLRAFSDRKPSSPKSLRRKGNALRKGLQDAKSVSS